MIEDHFFSKKCGTCGYSRSTWDHYDYSMKRIYVKFERSWKTAGWICPYCARCELDENLFKLFFNRSERTASIRYKNTFKFIGVISCNQYGVMTPRITLTRTDDLKPNT